MLIMNEWITENPKVSIIKRFETEADLGKSRQDQDRQEAEKSSRREPGGKLPAGGTGLVHARFQNGS
jgi:hypothetical protein